MLKKITYPRISSMATFFENTASGVAGRPQSPYRGCEKNFNGNSSCIEFYKEHYCQRGIFDDHFFSSIPYILEEECRLGSNILSYFLKRSGGCLYTLGTAEATMARTIGKLGGGKITTFSCTPTKSNLESFNRLGIPENSYLHISPFNEITNSDICYYIKNFQGFDIIVEDTTFQMYGNNRKDQIDYVKQKLKADGLMVFIEKFNCEYDEEYIRREEIKDQYFKNRFFEQEDIIQKRYEVLDTMHNGQVTLKEFSVSLSDHFKYAIIIWNSTNFYSIIASNSKKNLLQFVHEMPEVFIPKEFCFMDKLPYPLLGLLINE